MIQKNKKQLQRNIIMIIGAIVVAIILVFAYLEITSEEPTQQHLLKIKEELQVNMSGMEYLVWTVLLNHTCIDEKKIMTHG